MLLNIHMVIRFVERTSKKAAGARLPRFQSYPQEKGMGRVKVGSLFRVGKGPVAQPGIVMHEDGADPNPKGGAGWVERGDIQFGGEDEALRCAA
jgi:hypothetical protein